jgi:tRNA(fMet)-specific endonuclease VapC
VKFLLDTNACIDVIRKKPPQVLKEFLRHDIEDIGISVITLSELEYGVEKSSKPDQNKAALIEFLAPLTVLPYDHHAAVVYGKIRAVLEKQGRSIGPLDILIGAHALAVKATLVTNNKREFERIPGLKVENWF